MTRDEFSSIRSQLEKTQYQMAQLLGTSLKAVQSFEQGWRNIPVHIERQVLYLFVLKKLRRKKGRPCWMVRRCPVGTKRRCPAWEFQVGHFCCLLMGRSVTGRFKRAGEGR